MGEPGLVEQSGVESAGLREELGGGGWRRKMVVSRGV